MTRACWYIAHTPGACPRGRAAWRHLRARGLAIACATCLAGCLGSWPVPNTHAPGPKVVLVDAWGGRALATPAQPQRINRITIHHQGEVWPPVNKPDDEPQAYLRRLQGWSRQTQRWIDIPYHYVIAPDGQIYATRDRAAPGDTNTDYQPRGHALLMLMGNFDVQQPTAAQLKSALALMHWLASQHGLGADAIASHKDYSKQTACPGAALYALLPSLREAVRRALVTSAEPAGGSGL